MFINKLMGDKDPEEKPILTSVEFVEDVCCICSKTLHLDDKEVFCIGCSNISHLACLETGNTGSALDLNDEQVKTFKCQKCNTENNLQLNQEKNQANVSVPMYKRLEKKGVGKGPTRDRKCTDVSAILFLFLVFTVFISLVVSLGGIDVFVKGSDSCGNICGKVNNYPSESLRHNHGCMGADHSDKRLVLFVDYIESLSDVSSSPRECVSTCPMNMNKILNFCMHFGSPTPSASIEVKQEINFSSNNDSSEKFITQESKFVLEELNDDLPKIKGVKSESSFGGFLKVLFRIKAKEWFTIERLFKLWLLAVAMSSIIVIIFCCLPTYAVWIVPVTMVVTFCSGTGYFVGIVWEDGFNSMIGYITIILLAILLLNLLTITLRKDHFKLFKAQHKYMVVFYKEAGRLLATFPSLLLFSFLTMFYVLTTVGIWFRVALSIESANVIYSSFNHYGSTLQIIARYLWIGIGIWELEFILNCQRMVFAGLTAHWYHEKDKSKVNHSIVIRSIIYLIRYHLGTLVYGSIIFHPITFLKYLSKAICCRPIWTKRDSLKLKLLFTEFFLKFIPDLLVFWYNITSSQTFNLTAMHGKSYCESEAKSLNLKANHYIESLLVMKFSATFPTMNFYVITSTTLLSIYLFGWTEQYGKVDFDNENFLVVFMTIIVVSFLTGHFILSAYQLIVDQLYICFIEDMDTRNELKAEFSLALNKLIVDQLYIFIIDDKDTRNELKAEFSLALNKQNCVEKVSVKDDKKEDLTPTSTDSASTLSITDEPATLITKSNDGTTTAKEIDV